MTDLGPEAHSHGESPTGHSGAAIDSEINVRRSIEVALWLGGTTIGALVVGYFIYIGLAKWTAGQDPTASPLAEANQNALPPAPNLQIQPERELAAMRETERERLTTWGWTDKSLGLAHMPIEDAIDRLAVPEPPPVATGAAPSSLTPSPVMAETAQVPAHAGSAH